jgi:hypothetical protein
MKKRMRTTTLCPLNMVILQQGKLKIKQHQMCPMMIFVGSLLMHREDAKVTGGS